MLTKTQQNRRGIAGIIARRGRMVARQPEVRTREKVFACLASGLPSDNHTKNHRQVDNGSMYETAGRDFRS
jgi:hypothetical protein